MDSIFLISLTDFDEKDALNCSIFFFDVFDNLGVLKKLSVSTNNNQSISISNLTLIRAASEK